MSHFYGSIRGSGRTEATRGGSRGSGISAHVRGWDVGVQVSGYVDRNGNDNFRVYITGGSNSPSRSTEALRITRTPEGKTEVITGLLK